GDVVKSRRTVKALLCVQMIFCAFVLFAAGLFRATFDRLSSLSFVFSYDRVLVLAAGSKREGRVARLTQLRETAGRLPGVEAAGAVALCEGLELHEPRRRPRRGAAARARARRSARILHHPRHRPARGP